MAIKIRVAQSHGCHIPSIPRVKNGGSLETIPDILPEGVKYTKALILSRPAYNLEALASLLIAVALLGLVGFHWLFAGNALGFPASAALVLTVVLSPPKPPTTQVGPGAALRAVRAFTLPRHGCAGCWRSTSPSRLPAPW